MRSTTIMLGALAAVGLVAAPPIAQAAKWSDTFIGYRYGSNFKEPGRLPDQDIRKHIVQLTHASGYETGQNFVNLDYFTSDSNDRAENSDDGASEFYLTYRHQFHLGKLFDKDLSFGPVKEMGITAGFDLNTKNTAFAPAKRLLVLGPTLKLALPKGFFDLSLLVAKEWNHCGLGAPVCPNSNHTFDTQLSLSTAWGIPFEVGAVPLKFQGFFNWLTDKGKQYGSNTDTEPEFLMRTSVMADVGQLALGKKNVVWLGIGYEAWRNKFGNDGVDSDALMLQAEWHF